MKQYIVENARQIAALATVGLGTLALRHVNHVDYSSHPSVARLAYVRKHSNVARILVKLETLEQPELLSALGECLDAILEISGSLAAGDVIKKERDECVCHLNRLSVRAQQIGDDIIDRTKRTADEDVFREGIYCAQDELPALFGILESVLHNAILDAR